MILLSRTVRFCINPPNGTGLPALQADSNGYAGVPASRGMSRYYELEVICRGVPDAVTGYFMDIKSIDRAARAVAMPIVQRVCDSEPAREPAAVLAEVIAALNTRLNGTVHEVVWRVTPFYAVSMTTATSDRVMLRQRFEFAAAHRLHTESLSAEENRKLFGRCNNPSGHGHNYVLEPAVSVSLSDAASGRFGLALLEKLVYEHVVNVFDHTHLNIDTPEFDSKRGGVNPSVEQIAKVFFDRLNGPISTAGASLQSVTVWETEKTRATYPA